MVRGKIAEGEMSKLPSGRVREMGSGSWRSCAGSAVCSAFSRAVRALDGFVGSEEENS